MLIVCVATSGVPSQPVRLAVMVNDVGPFTGKLLVPPEALTPTGISVVLSVMVTVSALETAQVRFTVLAGGVRQYVSEMKLSIVIGCFTITETVREAVPPFPLAG